ncbi:arsenic metallochaperone ArsD family protein [Rothia sp. CCM 9418]|uniref:arsenic metallochaperone ArsD family protein n=1 Tax=Rothia sp. CCM 9418 TaxID=3402661 RepID=UPI003AE8988A
MADTVQNAELEVFIPAPGENPDDPQDIEREEFLRTAQQLLDEGLDIVVYSTDSYPSAFTQCVPVADQIEISGADVLPILLVDGEVKVSYHYPDAEQLQRFSRARSVQQKKVSATATGCGPVATESAPPAKPSAPAGFAATLAGLSQIPSGTPDIGQRQNLMESAENQDEFSDEELSEVERRLSGAPASGGCGCGGCGCG